MLRNFLFLFIIALCACQSEDTRTGKTVFRYNESNGITSLDPAFARNLENMWAVNQLFDGLVELDSTLQIRPLIAESWDITDSGKTYTFFLRDDVKFHPSPLFRDSLNRTVNAEDVAFSFERILDPELASPGKWIFDPLRDSAAIEVIDERTIVLHLDQPFPPFLGMLTTQFANIVPKEVVTHYGADFRSNPTGTGPFKFAFWMEDVALVFHKFDDFWERDSSGETLPYLDAVKISFVRDMSAEYLGLLQGQFDFMSGLHPAYKDELLSTNGELNDGFDQIRFQRTPFIKTDYIGILSDDSILTAQNHPFKDKRVRQALNYAVDRASMVRYLRNNSVFEAGHGFVPKGLPAFDPSAEYGVNYDVEKAKALLAEAGFPEGQGIPPVAISTTGDYVDLCEFLQFQWSKIGIQVEIDVLAGSAHREKVARSQAMMFRKSWLADYASAENFLALFHTKNFTPGGPNYTHYSSAEFDSLYERAVSTTDDLTRRQLYRQMDSLVMDASPVIPLFYDQVSHFIRQDVTHFETNPVNMLDLKRTKKEEE
ncbi:ABC transporter substrate-binding protein [Sanyastnella coralliicola]|uniref:ABC transporter substrate-binding protein n=1 Tax=Sanyastnella coralliicola TaxID=3069118 RepID=UPI0027B93445|nr:ABC transporter substrate-binding protein [Longitalea sp. SCSIO 12813]